MNNHSYLTLGLYSDDEHLTLEDGQSVTGSPPEFLPSLLRQSEYDIDLPHQSFDFLDLQSLSRLTAVLDQLVAD